MSTTIIAVLAGAILTICILALPEIKGFHTNHPIAIRCACRTRDTSLRRSGSAHVPEERVAIWYVGDVSSDCGWYLR
jgi:hypothetical protein